MKLKGKKVLVYGLGASGQESCRLLHIEGACVSLYDDDKRFSGLFCYDKSPLKGKYDFVVVSPGIKVVGNEIISHFEKEGKIVSELDLGYSFVKGKIIAVTGTNGKTTVCSLLGEIFSNANIPNFVCGNIGLPLCSVAKKTTRKSVTIVEVSNFQLELSKKFHPDVGTVLNITEDHIDRHGSFEEYKRVKEKLFQNFSSKDVAVINLDDEESLKLNFPKRQRFFSKRILKKGAYVKNGYVFCDKKKIMLQSEIPLVGEKNLENILACVQIARLFKIKPQIIRKSIAFFKAPPHRLEFVCERNAVKFYNDSKSTNVACTIMAIESLKEENLILLVGGRNKDNDFDKLFSLNFSAKKIVAFGESCEKIKKSAEKFDFECQIFEKMEEAVFFAKNFATAKDVVLLSPACASFDEFASYSARGQRFKELVLGGK